MRRTTATLVAVVAAMVTASPAVAAPSPSVAALQVALRAKGHYPGVVDGMNGPLTRTGLQQVQRRAGLTPTGTVGRDTRRALGALGRPLLGQRELGVGAIGWDVASLEFRLVRFGLPLRAVDGTFTPATAKALTRFQKRQGLDPDGIAGPRTFRALVRGAAATPFTPPVVRTHVVRSGESFYAIAAHYRVSPLVLAERNGLKLDFVLVPGQRLKLPAKARAQTTPGAATTRTSASRDAVRISLDRWSAVYGVDPRLSRAVAWMESGFQQDVVSHAGAIGVMQLLPETWEWLDALIGVRTPRTYDGNVRAGVRYLRWLLDEFDGNTRLALAGYYQGARAVRERGLFDDTKQYVSVILQLYGSV